MADDQLPERARVTTERPPLDIGRLVGAYSSLVPDLEIPAQRVAFGTSGHRGSALARSFNEAHILAIAEAICRYRIAHGIDGPLFLGRDTHALSEPAFVTALEVFAAHGVATMIDDAGAATPTPVISHAILAANRGRTRGLADGVVITPSHNPPEDGGFKYNATHGGPADTDATGWIERTANELLADGRRAVRRLPLAEARASGFVHPTDYVGPYVEALAECVDMAAIGSASLRIGIDALGGAAGHYWARIAERYRLDATIMNAAPDPSFGFMAPDWDGRIRMDCSSPHAMAGLIGLRDRFDIAWANDPDADRHGIVTPSAGLLAPNHYMTAAIAYLFAHRPGWNAGCAIGKTLVSSGIIDRLAGSLGRRLVEVPVGFKWFVDGLHDGTLGFAGEESAGASFLRRDGTVWTTDKDGLILGLLAAEMTAVTGRDPGELYAELTQNLGAPDYARIDAAATPAQKALLKNLSPSQVSAATLAGDPITARLTTASGNGAAIGGLKVTTDHGWFAARPSGTEDVYKIYAESFRGAVHLTRIQAEARGIVDAALRQG